MYASCGRDAARPPSPARIERHDGRAAPRQVTRIIIEAEALRLPSLRPPSGEIQIIPRVAQLSCPGKGALLDQVLQIPCGRGAGRPRDADVVLRVQAPLEAVEAFAEHPPDRLLLTFVHLAAQSLVEPRLGDVEVHARERVLLCLEYRAGKI